MIDLDMTARALDLVLRDVRGMHQSRLTVLVDLRRLIVAAPAHLLRNGAVALHDIGVAVLALDAAIDVLRVIEIPGGQADLVWRDAMAVLATAERFFVPPVLQSLEVAQEAGVQRDDDMLALHDL